MKKLLFLTALLTSLFIGFTACSDNTIEVIDDWTKGNTGIPRFFSDVTGELAFNQHDNVFYFRATESKNESLLKMMGDSIFPISGESLKQLSCDLKSYIGSVTVEMEQSFKDSIWIKSITSLNESRGRFLTPEFDTPPPAWFFEPQN